MKVCEGGREFGRTEIYIVRVTLSLLVKSREQIVND